MMDIDLIEKVAAVTGGADGKSLSIAETRAGAGAKVAMFGSDQFNYSSQFFQISRKRCKSLE